MCCFQLRISGTSMIIISILVIVISVCTPLRVTSKSQLERFAIRTALAEDRSSQSEYTHPSLQSRRLNSEGLSVEKLELLLFTGLAYDAVVAIHYNIMILLGLEDGLCSLFEGVKSDAIVR
ncbi:hypothetical protein Tco_0578327 [Tanacetum coccineum]